MKEYKKTWLLLFFIGVVPIIWFSILIAPFFDKGLLEIIKNIQNINPFKISICKNTVKSIVFFILIYIILIGIYYSTKHNYRKGEEHGSAIWGDTKSINRKYKQKPISDNKILTQNFMLGLNGKKHRRNLNVLVCGGSGSGKTRFYGKPNVMQCSNNTSYVILDPKGEILKTTGNLLKEKGYEIKVLDLVNMENSFCYNPFVYLKDDNDVQRLVTNLFKATTPKGAQTQDPFWDVTASMLLLALIFYLKYEAPEDEQNFPMVMEMIMEIEVKEFDENYKSPLDILFMKLEERNPNHIALKYYKTFKSGAGKTLKSIKITLLSRLEKFNLEKLSKLVITDELELSSIGEKKIALFAIIPDNDTSFNFLVSILYTQLFQQLFYIADYKYNGALPKHVHFVMDEFANVSLPDDFCKILSVMRSRNISVSIIIQNLAQLKALFEKEWESIVGNCDTFIYLGGNEQSTHKYVSELLGKATIDTISHGKTTGNTGNYSTNYQIIGRELMTPDEVRALDNNYALLFIRGERPIMDLKYNILKHPNIKLTTDGGGKPYSVQNENNNSTAKVVIEAKEPKYKTFKEENKECTYNLISEEEIEQFIKEEFYNE